MPWTVDKSSAEFGVLTNSEQYKFDQFQNAIEHNNKHPKEAAKEAGDTDYKCLTGNQYQIRLSQGTRATFLVEDMIQRVKVLQVGGHT